MFPEVRGVATVSHVFFYDIRQMQTRYCLMTQKKLHEELCFLPPRFLNDLCVVFSLLLLKGLLALYKAVLRPTGGGVRNKVPVIGIEKKACKLQIIADLGYFSFRMDSKWTCLTSAVSILQH